jgi:hypothetical protein
MKGNVKHECIYYCSSRVGPVRLHIRSIRRASASLAATPLAATPLCSGIGNRVWTHRFDCQLLLQGWQSPVTLLFIVAEPADDLAV